MTNYTIQSRLPAQPNWLQKLKHPCKQNINANQRLDYMIFLREKLFPKNQQTQNAKVITHFSTATINILIEFCKSLDDWPLIIYCCKEYQNRIKNTIHNIKQQSINNLRLLGKAYQQQGLFDEAEQCLRHALFENSHHQALINDYQKFLQIVKNSPAGSEELCTETLLLTPLHTYHEKNFFWQYADPNIADFCNLPDFDNDDEEDWRQWLLECQQEQTKHLFAVNHREWGFIGSVSLQVFKDVGFFYFWIGTDFQGYGFGPQAVNILLDWGCRYLGLRCCYTRVYKNNTPSKKALEKLNFRPLPFKVVAPCEAENEEEYEEEYIYYWGDQKTDRLLFLEINQFFIDTDSELRVFNL